MEKRVETILEKMVKDYTLGKTQDGGYEFRTYIDYWDIENIHEMVKGYIGDIKIPEDDMDGIVSSLEMEILDNLMECDSAFNYVLERFKSYTDDGELVDYFIANFYDYVNVYLSELDHIEDTELDIDITFSTYNERNYDMALISDILDNETVNIEELEDTGVGVLLGYLGEDVSILNGNSKLGQQFKDELLNILNNMNKVTVGAKATLGDLIKISNKEVDSIVIDKDSITGIYTPWVGGGSLLGIDLPNDIIVPLKDIYKDYDDAGVVGITTSRYHGYSMEEVYGLCGDERKLIEIK